MEIAMKKYILPLLLSLLLLLSSCAAPHAELTLPALPFEGEVTIVNDGGEIEVLFIMTDGQTGNYRILSPESIAGTVFSRQNGVYIGSVGEFSTEYLPGFLPDRGLLFEMFSLEGEPLRYTVTEDGMRYTVQSYIEEEWNFLFFFAEDRLIKLVVEGEKPITVYFEKERAE